LRKKEKEIKDSGMIDKILQQASLIRIAMIDDSEPYIVVMNFGYWQGRIYLHSALEGRKISILKKNNRVAFQTDLGVEIVSGRTPCNWDVKYLSAVGSGRAYFLESIAEKTEALDIIMTKYSGIEKNQYPAANLNKTCIIRIDIDEISGKQSGMNN
jgi:nitroimidazol reductase NimA-like FMN-containing flavoprotein (pyridoxamine 5'-phosphate oxidase superfamily)